MAGLTGVNKMLPWTNRSYNFLRQLHTSFVLELMMEGLKPTRFLLISVHSCIRT